MSGAYYNEPDPVAAEWLRNLIKAGLIADGEVDERDIRDVAPNELAGFVQCHFFAGIGIWSGALRAAGWPDDEPIWSGSCPCQPFSAAGAGEGFADDRHLWPHWHWIIEQRRPRIIVGEQVAGKDGLGWNDLVSADLAASGYAFASVNLCAGGFGLEWRRSAYAEWLERAIHDCPDPMVARQLRNFADWAGQSLSVGGLHIRQRQYFVGVEHGLGARLERQRGDGQPSDQRGRDAGPGAGRSAAAASEPGGLAHDGRRGIQSGDGPGPERGTAGGDEGAARQRQRGGQDDPAGGASGGMGDDRGGRRDEGEPRDPGTAESPGRERGHEPDRPSGLDRAGQADGGRSPFDWLLCRDGVWRATRPGTLPLAHAVAGRVGKLRAYGNGLDFETATEFCRTVSEMRDAGEL